MNNQNSKPGRTPQDKINRHVNFALNNSESGRENLRYNSIAIMAFNRRAVANITRAFGNLPLEHRIKILKILKRLYRLPATNDSWSTGLCYHITAVEGLSVKASMNYTAEHFKTWKYFSGADNNPIPREAEINKTMSRKQLRKNLCGHVIKSIKEELKYVL